MAAAPHSQLNGCVPATSMAACHCTTGRTNKDRNDDWLQYFDVVRCHCLFSLLRGQERFILPALLPAAGNQLLFMF